MARTSACSSLWRSASLSIVRLMLATLLCRLSLREHSLESLCVGENDECCFSFSFSRETRHTQQ